MMIVQDEHGAYLMQFRDGRKKNINDYTFTFFGGSLEEGEDGKIGVIREFFEETGISCKIDEISLIQRGEYEPGWMTEFYKMNRIVNPHDIRLSEGSGFAFIPYHDLNRVPLSVMIKEFIKKHKEL
ncbi:MAG: NUDIX hydrolase [Alphaproteobacteria bacterium]